MACFCATNLFLVSFGIFLWAGEAAGFCASVFETQQDHTLLGQVIETVNVTDEFECHRKCIQNNTCKSFNVHPPKSNPMKNLKTCEINNQTRQTKPKQYKRKIGSSYHGSVEVSCVNIMETNSKKKSGRCHPGYSGKQCTVKKGSSPDFPGLSCKDIRKFSNAQKNGEYWIDPKDTGHPFKVYCDMTTDGGGWLLVMNVITGSSHYNQLSVMTSYRGISDYHSNKMVITTSALKELYGDLHFQQIRFHCRKHGVGRTFHVVTSANSSGNAVVQYFSGLTDAFPDSCGSYVTMKDDDSELSKRCSEWNHGKSGKWSRSVGRWNSTVQRLYNHAAWVSGHHHWDLVMRNPFECDDMGASLSSGDFWKVFVR
ncbi:fibrinogen C domain-containing protein 1-B-like [Acropora muricata]|uniref:fibrinogen C domain-containing protein 1-B-like n=1 Tax=Acropora muricata TaxID=159855 RepID=UPI0034E55D6D